MSEKWGPTASSNVSGLNRDSITGITVVGWRLAERVNHRIPTMGIFFLWVFFWVWEVMNLLLKMYVIPINTPYHLPGDHPEKVTLNFIPYIYIYI